MNHLSFKKVLDTNIQKIQYIKQNNTNTLTQTQTQTKALLSLATPTPTDSSIMPKLHTVNLYRCSYMYIQPYIAMQIH